MFGKYFRLQCASRSSNTTQSRIAILVAIAVYIMAGTVIYRKRKYLDGFLNPLNENPFTNLVPTESHSPHETRPGLSHEGPDKGTPEIPGTEASPDFAPYSINIETAPVSRPVPALLRMRTLTRDVAQQETNAEAWLYARVAFLFFIALMITWVHSPSVPYLVPLLALQSAKCASPDTIERQPSLRPCALRFHQLWSKLCRRVRLSAAGLLERNRIHNHLANCVQGTVGWHDGQDPARSKASRRHGARGEAREEGQVHKWAAKSEAGQRGEREGGSDDEELEDLGKRRSLEGVEASSPTERDGLGGNGPVEPS